MPEKWKKGFKSPSHDTKDNAYKIIIKKKQLYIESLGHLYSDLLISQKENKKINR